MFSLPLAISSPERWATEVVPQAVEAVPEGHEDFETQRIENIIFTGYAPEHVSARTAPVSVL
ncbi:hypothetical protein [Nocardia noduli]|uniref:hypothetical protein n=1 Tax=Nocardia noduli TaxID=2815722 RepID=UPI001C219C97|nr:hypothetical protein [Nocardia noduli]